jgi:DNA-binding transcriptional LysR family regulator
MGKIIDWDSRVGSRVRLRDLHILFAVIQYGSMAKAGVHLGMSQSAQAIAAIEHTLDVRLLDRTSRGVEPTIYGSALLRRGRAAFDELRLGVKEIECLADPAAGEVRVACSEWLAANASGAAAVIEVFRTGLPPPRIAVSTFSVHLRNFLGMSGHFIVALPVSILEIYADLFGLKRLPIELPEGQLPIGVVTLKNRTLSATAELFIERAREVTKSRATGPEKRTGSAGKRISRHVFANGIARATVVTAPKTPR